MKLKVCGLSRPVEVETCIKNDVNFCGFILNYSKSHRYISYKKAQKLLSIKKNKTQYVGVLVNPSSEELKKFSQLDLDYFQLYDQYSSKSLNDIKNKFQKKIITTIQVKNKSDIELYKKIIDEVVDVELSPNWENRSFYEGGKGLQNDFNQAKFVVSYNSNLLTQSVMQGIPSICWDIRSMASPMCLDPSQMHDLSLTYKIDRKQHLHNLAYTQWTRAEIRDGDAWNHLKQYGH